MMSLLWIDSWLLVMSTGKVRYDHAYLFSCSKDACKRDKSEINMLSS